MFELLKEAFHLLSDIKGLIEWGGPILVCAIVFVETGLFVGFFLPGDSLLVTAGVFAAAGHIKLAILMIFVPLCAFIGDQVGYWIGRRAGEALYKRNDSLVFKKKHLEKAHEFYEKYGGKTIVIARFIPIIRTFAAPVAGAARMKYRKYVCFSLAGGLLWVWSMTLIGFILGSSVPNIDKKIHFVIAAVIALSLLPPAIEMARQRNRNVRQATAAKSEKPVE